MRVHNSTRYAAIAALIGGLACAGNKARTTDTTPNEAAAARDTTRGRDTVGGQTENPSGYRGMQRDTTHRAVGADTTGYGRDTTGASRARDTSGTASADSSSWNKSNSARPDSTGMAPTGDTTGYHPSQQSRDSTAR